jgi:hypothetical protein
MDSSPPSQDDENGPAPEPRDKNRSPKTYGEPAPLLPADPDLLEQLPPRTEQRLTENIPDTQGTIR